MRFLVVDDSSTMRRIIINSLNKLGHDQIVEASNGREGLDRLATTDVDFIITDWNMPYMNGIEFIRTVRTLEKSKETPVLMVTTHAATNDIVEALRAGVNSYIVKPFSCRDVQGEDRCRVRQKLIIGRDAVTPQFDVQIPLNWRFASGCSGPMSPFPRYPTSRTASSTW